MPYFENYNLIRSIGFEINAANMFKNSCRSNCLGEKMCIGQCSLLFNGLLLGICQWSRSSEWNLFSANRWPTKNIRFSLVDHWFIARFVLPHLFALVFDRTKTLSWKWWKSNCKWTGAFSGINSIELEKYLNEILIVETFASFSTSDPINTHSDKNLLLVRSLRKQEKNREVDRCTYRFSFTLNGLRQIKKEKEKKRIITKKGDKNRLICRKVTLNKNLRRKTR